MKYDRLGGITILLMIKYVPDLYTFYKTT